MDCLRCGSPMVVRTARSGRRAGHEFWGCSRYPACRATIDKRDELPVSGVVGTPGASAQRTFERHKRTFERRRIERLPTTLALAAVLGVGAFVLVGRSNAELGVLWGLILGVSVLAIRLLPPNTTTAWSTGARGEERTAEFLDPLAADGFVILHDRKIPRSPANIDHLVIGPTGVFVIETKNIAGDLRISGDEARIGGRRINVVEEVRREVEAVRTALRPGLETRGLSVVPVPVICAHRADLPFFRRTVAGIRIVSGKDLVRLIRDSPTVLSEADVVEVARVARARLSG